MKEWKANIRRHMIDRRIHPLEQAGYSNITIIDVKEITTGLSARNDSYSL